MNQQLDNTLIENALALTGKKMSYVKTYNIGKAITTGKFHNTELSIEKFCFFLLSPEFIEKYHKRYTDYPYWDNSEDITYGRFGIAIGKYQSGNEKPLIELLSKIGKN